MNPDNVTSISSEEEDTSLEVVDPFKPVKGLTNAGMTPRERNTAIRFEVKDTFTGNPKLYTESIDSFVRGVNPKATRTRASQTLAANAVYEHNPDFYAKMGCDVSELWYHLKYVIEHQPGYQARFERGRMVQLLRLTADEEEPTKAIPEPEKEDLTGI